MNQKLEPRGYRRVRPRPMPFVEFEIDGHRFETGNRDLWVTCPGDARIDRIKVTRAVVSRSARMGYPKDLLWPPGEIRKTVGQLQLTARIWLSWRKTPEGASFPVVGLDPWVRQMEQATA